MTDMKKELSIYNQLYDARTVHSKNLVSIITEHVDTLSNLVILAANNKLTYVDSAILLDYNGLLIKRLSFEKSRFEREIKVILGMDREQPHDVTTDVR